MKAVMMVLALTASLSNLTVAIHGRSSFLQTTKDRYLVGHVISDHRKVSSISSCAQLCLKRRPSCRSINYGGEEGETILSQELRRNPEKNPGAKSALYEVYPVSNADPVEVYCELDIAGGGFTFLPHSLTLRSDAQQIVDALFKDKKTVLLKLRKNVDGSQWYTLIQPHPNYADIDFGVLVNYSGYTKPKNAFMQKYVFLGILPKSMANKKTTQGFRSNGIIVQFGNCDGNPNGYFALFPNHHHQLPSDYAEKSGFENTGIAVNWRSHAKAVINGILKMPNEFFFLTELNFGGCGCYTSSDRWKKFGYNSSAIGLR